ncbi:hypothetical protein KY334_05285, partial [Candidatus Woesearchaeota archaeon]|nr:hypothetical protein [Candidatus Woesearchaeota archaeon]
KKNKGYDSLDALILDSSGITREFEEIKYFYEIKGEVYTIPQIIQETLIDYRSRNEESYRKHKELLDLLIKDKKVIEINEENELIRQEKSLLLKLSNLTKKLIIFNTVYEKYFKTTNQFLKELHRDYDINEVFSFQTFFTYCLRDKDTGILNKSHSEELLKIKNFLRKESEQYLIQEKEKLSKEGIELNLNEGYINERFFIDHLARLFSEMLLSIHKNKSNEESKNFLYDKYNSNLETDINVVLLSYAYPLKDNGSLIGIVTKDRDLIDLVKLRRNIITNQNV